MEVYFAAFFVAIPLWIIALELKEFKKK